MHTILRVYRPTGGTWYHQYTSVLPTLVCMHTTSSTLYVQYTPPYVHMCIPPVQWVNTTCTRCVYGTTTTCTCACIRYVLHGVLHYYYIHVVLYASLSPYVHMYVTLRRCTSVECMHTTLSTLQCTRTTHYAYMGFTHQGKGIPTCTHYVYVALSSTTGV